MIHISESGSNLKLTATGYTPGKMEIVTKANGTCV